MEAAIDAEVRSAEEQVVGYSRFPLYSYPGLERWILPHQLWQLIGPGRRILDVGCGDGCWTAQMRDRGNHVAGLEIWEEGVARTRQRGIEVHRVDLNAESFPFPDRSFDLVTTLSVMEYVFSYANVFREVWRVLRPGGELLFLGPNFSSWRYRWQLALGIWERKESDVRYWTPRILKKKLEAQGFVVELYPQRGKTLHRKIIGWFRLPDRLYGLLIASATKPGRSVLEGGR